MTDVDDVLAVLEGQPPAVGDRVMVLRVPGIPYSGVPFVGVVVAYSFASFTVTKYGSSPSARHVWVLETNAEGDQWSRLVQDDEP